MSDQCVEAQEWDSEKRDSPYSTVSDVEDEFCDACGDAHDCDDCVRGG
ncbi:MAG: hypothetical protein H0V97_08115 [Actinobacteria bacterium]|nr:hypothetical protein [Actinomycetota bacterium]